MKNLFKLLLILLNSHLMAQMNELKEINTNGLNLAYYEKGVGETIILLHGWPQTSYVWRNNFTELSKNNHVIALDLPGLGKSGKVEKTDTKNIANIIHEFTKLLGIEKFHLVGHDIGSWVAVAYALLFENKLLTLTVIDAGIPGLMDASVFQPKNAGKVWQFYFHAVDEIPEFLTAGKEKEYLSWYFKNKSHVKTAILDTDLEIYYNDYKDKMKNGFSYYRSFEESSEQNKLFDKKLTIPVLAIGGRFALADQVGEAMKKIASNVQAEVIENSGHYIPEEQPEKLNKLILKHVKGSK